MELEACLDDIALNDFVRRFVEVHGHEHIARHFVERVKDEDEYAYKHHDEEDHKDDDIDIDHDQEEKDTSEEKFDIDHDQEEKDTSEENFDKDNGEVDVKQRIKSLSHEQMSIFRAFQTGLEGTIAEALAQRGWSDGHFAALLRDYEMHENILILEAVANVVAFANLMAAECAAVATACAECEDMF